MGCSLNKSLVGYVFLVAGLGFVLSWILPNHYYPWPAAYQDFLSFSSLLVLGGGLVLGFPIKVPRYFVIFIIVAFIPLLQCVLGVTYFFGTAFLSFLYVLGFSLALYIGYSFARDSHGRDCLLNTMAVALVLGAVISVWIALKQWLMLSGSIWIVDLPSGGRPYANLAQPNNLATLLCMAVAAVFYTYEKNKLGRLSAGFLVAFLLFGVALTQSRTPWVGFLVVAIFWFWKGAVCKSRLSYYAVFAWLFYFVLCVLMLPEIADVLLLHSPDLAERVQSLERLALWEQFWHAIWQGPLWGYGWGQVALAQVAISPSYPVQMITAHAHNFIFDLMLWNGPVLGGLIALFLGCWVFQIIWRASSIESFFALAASGFLLVHGLFELPLEYAYFLLPLGLLLGSAAAERAGEDYVISKKAAVSLVVVAYVTFFWVWREYRVAEEDYRLMRFESARIGTLKAEQPAPDLVLLTQIREFIRFARVMPVEGMSGVELEWMRKVAHLQPHAPVLLRYALALGLNGKPALAFEQLQLLKIIHGSAVYENCLVYLRELEPMHPQLGDIFKTR